MSDSEVNAKRRLGGRWLASKRSAIEAKINEGWSTIMICEQFIESADPPPFKLRMFQRYVAKIRSDLNPKTDPALPEIEPQLPPETAASSEQVKVEEPLKVGSNYSFREQTRRGEEKTLDELVHGVKNDP